MDGGVAVPQPAVNRVRGHASGVLSEQLSEASEEVLAKALRACELVGLELQIPRQKELEQLEDGADGVEQREEESGPDEGLI